LPDNPVIARQELRDVERLLQQLVDLGGRDSKLEHFIRALQMATDDGRSCLVFSEFTDTVEYLRDSLFPRAFSVRRFQPAHEKRSRYGDALACYTGDGGQVHEEGAGVRYLRKRSPLV
jgi:hypothetical protein